MPGGDNHKFFYLNFVPILHTGEELYFCFHSGSPKPHSNYRLSGRCPRGVGRRRRRRRGPAAYVLPNVEREEVVAWAEVPAVRCLMSGERKPLTSRHRCGGWNRFRGRRTFGFSFAARRRARRIWVNDDVVS